MLEGARFLLTAIGLTPVGSSTVLIYKKKQYTEQHSDVEYTERNTRNNKNT